MHKKAFTLIELLVVIAIIAILAAILFPVFAQAKISAKRTLNLSNFKQDVLAELMYSGDYDDYYVPLQVSPNGYSVDVFGPNPELVIQNNGQLIQPYLHNFLILRNPLDPQAIDTVLRAGTTTQIGLEFNETQRSDHGYNFLYLNVFDVNQFFDGRNQSVIGAPARTIMITESVWNLTAPRAPQGGGNWFVNAPTFWNIDPDTFWWFGPWDFSNPADWYQYGGCYDYFKGQITIGWCDGHAKAVATPQLWAGCDPTMFWTVFDTSKYIWGGTTS